jgi:prefoldin subunit 5
MTRRQIVLFYYYYYCQQRSIAKEKELKAELETSVQQLSTSLEQVLPLSGSSRAVSDAHQGVESLRKERDELKQAQEKLMAELETLSRELERYKAEERKQQQDSEISGKQAPPEKASEPAKQTVVPLEQLLSELKASREQIAALKERNQELEDASVRFLSSSPACSCVRLELSFVLCAPSTLMNAGLCVVGAISSERIASQPGGSGRTEEADSRAAEGAGAALRLFSIPIPVCQSLTNEVCCPRLGGSAAGRACAEPRGTRRAEEAKRGATERTGTALALAICPLCSFCG